MPLSRSVLSVLVLCPVVEACRMAEPGRRSKQTMVFMVPSDEPDQAGNPLGPILRYIASYFRWR